MEGAIGFVCTSAAFFGRRFSSPKFSSNLVFRLALVLTSCLAMLGIRRRLRGLADREDEEENGSSRGLSDNTVLIMDGYCPMLVPVQVVTSMIKSRIPVLKFGEYVDRHCSQGEREEEDPSSCCAVCLGSIEREHFIREPSNCDHVFHRECLDSWIGEQRVTCPLCRCLMLPSRRNITFC